MRSAVVFLHGFLGSAQDWEFFEERLKDYFCFSPSLAGFDLSSFERCVTSLDRYIESEVGGKVHLVGYSLGGRIALHYALKRPEQLRSLTILAANPGIEDDAERRGRWESDLKLSQELEQLGLDHFVSKWYSQPLFHSLTERKELFRELLERRQQSNAHKCAQMLRGLSAGKQDSLWKEIERITVPTLLMAGGRDEKYSKIVKRMASLMLDTEAVIIPEAGHALHLELPYATLDVLTSFLSSKNILR